LTFNFSSQGQKSVKVKLAAGRTN